MIITNHSNLPQPLFEAVSNDSYSKGKADISVTQLLDPPRKVALTEQHWDEITEDCSDRIWSLVGQVMHGILERANTTGVAERRLYVKCAGWTVSGSQDAYYANGLLQDYKFVTSWKFKGGKAPIEYEAQANLYAELLRANGHPVRKLQIVAILRDWSKIEASRDPEYPQKQVMIINVPLWPEADAQKFMRERVILHQQARVELPLCTAEERWAKPDVFAVMAQGKARAVKLYESEEEAHAHASQNPAYFVQKRPGESTRCKHYCSAAKFCSLYQAIQESKDDQPALGKQAAS